MKNDKIYLAWVIFLTTLLLASFSAYAETADPTAALQQYVANLQKNPDDNALREKIIKLVQEMTPAPTIPEEAHQHFMMAQTYQKKAKSEVGYKLAIDEYKQVLLLAPWLPEAYNNLGILYEMVGNYDEAASTLKLYLLTNPPDAQSARDKIIEIEATKKLASAEAAHQKAKEEETKSKAVESLDGARYTYQSNLGGTLITDMALDIRGATLIFSSCLRHKAPVVIADSPIGVWVEEGRMQIVGRQANFSQPGRMPATFTISEDGKSVTCVQGMNTGITWMFYREK
jgi:tetratricopeptide (TPR) repeat protein